MKILILNDLHSGKTTPSTTHPGTIRQANNEAIDRLSEYVDLFNEEQYDLVMNLGDSIRDEKNREKDLILFESVMSVFNKIIGEKIFVAGNHELRTLSHEDMEQVINKLGMQYQKRGMLEKENTQIIWIDTEIDSKGLAYIPKNTIEWLGEVINPKKRMVIFSHYSVMSLDGKDSYYFDSGYEYMSYVNGKDIFQILEKCESVIAINAHTHMSTHKITSDIHSISALAFSENITAMQYPDANPGVYSVLEIDDDELIFRSYSGEYCFLNIEI